MLALVLASCAPKPPPPPAAQPKQLVGQPYRLGALWYYPRENYGLDETGLAAVIADNKVGRRTTDDEVFDPAVLMASHRTVQLPAILRVTNLENGRSLLVRANDRGPENPGRVVGLSRRAAALLGIAENGTAQVRVQVEAEPSRALAASLPQAAGEAPAMQIATVQTAAVGRESLPPPPGARGTAGPALSAAAPAVAIRAEAPPPPPRLPEQVTQGLAMPGRLFIQLGTFAAPDAARRQAARVPAARAEPFGPGRRPEWRVRLGPFPDATSTDRALEQVLRSGVSEARVLVD
ncbi:septal ring lytic transglycosylase RlpA family protein [Roseomonas elaeocarpi]|uniref:Endolytic peptidoglycan transglycosylase RlpA n=1 Tax=Roseomonas elaeocarpi TaxID=907779 RepID=A0ABV6K1V4_9PROT